MCPKSLLIFTVRLLKVVSTDKSRYLILIIRFSHVFSHRQYVFKSRFEETVAHFVSVSVVPWEIFELDLTFAVTVSLLRRKPFHGSLKKKSMVS